MKQSNVYVLILLLFVPGVIFGAGFILGLLFQSPNSFVADNLKTTKQTVPAIEEKDADALQDSLTSNQQNNQEWQIPPLFQGKDLHWVHDKPIEVVETSGGHHILSFPSSFPQKSQYNNSNVNSVIDCTGIDYTSLNDADDSIPDFEFTNICFDKCSFRDIIYKNHCFRNCSFRAADFRNSKFWGFSHLDGYFIKCDLTDALLDNAFLCLDSDTLRTTEYYKSGYYRDFNLAFHFQNFPDTFFAGTIFYNCTLSIGINQFSENLFLDAVLINSNFRNINIEQFRKTWNYKHGVLLGTQLDPKVYKELMEDPIWIERHRNITNEEMPGEDNQNFYYHCAKTTYKNQKLNGKSCLVCSIDNLNNFLVENMVFIRCHLRIDNNSDLADKVLVNCHLSVSPIPEKADFGILTE
ncbi:MAG: hypothetical protein IKW80_07890, partial [Thermoguttaceae bacterium]|nr:hypothetical protein [Thermoguttaceae bacterium]